MTMTWPRYFAKSTMLPSMSLARKAYTLSAYSSISDFRVQFSSVETCNSYLRTFVGSHKFGSAMKRFVALQEPPSGSQDVAIPTAASVIMGLHHKYQLLNKNLSFQHGYGMYLNIRVLPGDATALETCRNIPANIVTQLEVGD